MPARNDKKHTTTAVAEATVAVEDPEPIIESGGKTETVKQRGVCLSPRRVSGSIRTAFNYDELKKSMVDYNQARRNYVKIATRVSAKGECVMGGKKYTKEDVKEMDTALTRDLKLIPQKCRSFQQSRKRPPNEKHLVKCVNEIASVFGLDKPSFVDALVEGRRDVYVDESVSLFYITDNVVEFFKNANMGNGIAMFFSGSVPDDVRNISGVKKPQEAYAAVAASIGEAPEQVLGIAKDTLMKLADPRRIIIPLLKKHQMVSSPLLIKLLSQYVRVNGLTDPTTRRIVFDPTMKKWLGGTTTTRAIVGGKDYTPSGDAKHDLSGIERMKQQSGDSAVPLCDDVSMSHRMLFTLINMYRVKSAWVTAEMKDALVDDGARRAVEGLKAVCTFAKPPRVVAPVEAATA